MISQKDNDVALTVLRKYDSKCELILDSSHKVKLYNYDKTKNAWVIKDESEGALYLVKRYIPPLYKFIILSKYNKPGSHLCATEIPLSQYLISQINQTFYMFKNEFGIIQAIFFPNKPDCERFCIKVERIIKELKAESEKSLDLAPIAAKPRFVESIEGILSNNAVPNSSPNGKDKILSMLESARHRYEDVHAEKWSRQIDINELFQSTTSVNQSASTPGGAIDKVIPPYTQLPPHMVQVLMHEIDPSQTKYHRLAPTAPHPGVMPDKLDQFSSSSDTVAANAASSSAAATASRNGPNTLTVTELEKYLVQNASSPNQKKTADAATVTVTAVDDEDDDSQLLGPNRFESRDTPLNKDQLRDAMIYLLQNDSDGSFVSRLHSAYLQSLSRAGSLRK